MVLDILYTEEATGEVRGRGRKEEADGQSQVSSRYHSPEWPSAAWSGPVLRVLGGGSGARLTKSPSKSKTSGAMCCGPEACHFLTQAS